MKLAIGTVQFGLDYGITNQFGKVKDNELSKILDLAAKQGIDTLDCALAYGDSQTRLADSGLLAKFSVVTKISINHTLSLNEQLKEAKMQLRNHPIKAVLLHDADDVSKEELKSALTELAQLKSQFLIEKVGISTYRPETIELAFSTGFLEIVQFPCNLFDQRIIRHSIIDKLVENNVEIHCRSLFLQGLLLTPIEQIPVKFSQFLSNFKLRDNIAQSQNISLAHLAMSAITQFEKVDKWVIGVCNYQQLVELISNYKDTNMRADISSLATTKEQLIRPDLW